jgi:hypothetical protein
MFRSFFIISILSLVLFSCIEPTSEPYDLLDGTEVYVPIYASEEEAHEITVSAARPIENPGKIFLYQDYLIVNSPGKGFHVIDNSRPIAPTPLFFINVPGSNDVAIKDGYIYTDNYSDIVVFTIEQNENVQIIERMEDIMNNQLYPPYRNVYFECVDESKGVVIDWVLADDVQVNCYRP